MASVLHGSARTTPRLRAEFEASQESTRALVTRSGANPKTVPSGASGPPRPTYRWGPRVPKSTVLPPTGDVIVVAFRQKTLLPLDDVLGCLKDTPNLSRSALHRCPQRHGISRLPVDKATEKGKALQGLRDRLRPHR